MALGTRTLSRLMSTIRASFAWPLALAAGALLGSSAQAQMTPFTTAIDQAQEVPPTGSATTGFGFLVFNGFTNGLDFSINVSGFTSNEGAAHLHQGAVGISGPIIVALPLGLSISGLLPIPAGQVGNLLAGNTYTNFHTTNFPGGEVRGQVKVQPPTGVSSCDPSTAALCPCSNPPSGPGRGCDNSSGTGGAVLGAFGNASLSADTLTFTTTGEKPSATTILLQGLTTIPAVVFGQGLRCVNGNLKRLYTKTASNGCIAAPMPVDVRVAARSAALGDPILAGTPRSYMAYYRDPTILGGCPSASTFNGIGRAHV